MAKSQIYDCCEAIQIFLLRYRYFSSKIKHFSDWFFNHQDWWALLCAVSADIFKQLWIWQMANLAKNILILFLYIWFCITFNRDLALFFLSWSFCSFFWVLQNASTPLPTHWTYSIWPFAACPSGFRANINCSLCSLPTTFHSTSFTLSFARSNLHSHSHTLALTIVRAFSLKSSAIDFDMTSSVRICKIRSINCFNTSSNQLLAFYIETHFYCVRAVQPHFAKSIRLCSCYVCSDFSRIYLYVRVANSDTYTNTNTHSSTRTVRTDAVAMMLCIVCQFVKWILTGSKIIDIELRLFFLQPLPLPTLLLLHVTNITHYFNWFP